MVPASPLCVNTFVVSESFMSNIGLYIHVPFCDGKCAYCSFFSKKAGVTEFDTYTDNLIRMISLWGESVNLAVDTVYFGGGTPSLLGHERLVRIIGQVYNRFDVTDNAEVTIEVNPTSTSDLDFTELRKAGFNRLSVGLQSANDNELKILGRRHSAGDVEHTVKRAKAAGFDNISLDVMLAVPEQTSDSLDKTLEFCASLGVQHISSYILKVEKGTPFFANRDKLSLFNDDEQAAFYEQSVYKLAQLGYKQYEISNFCISGHESRHNLHYWHDDEYLGLGPSAHSFLDGKRFYYDNSFESFYGNKTVFESYGGDSEEYIMLALRLSEGLRFTDYKERFGHDVSDSLIKAAKRLEQNGLCRVTDKAVALTVKGFLVSNSVIAYLIENT